MYFEAFVDGNYLDFVQHPDSVRHALNAAVSAAQMGDHYLAYHRRREPSEVIAFPTIGKFVEHVSTMTNGAFRDIRSIANAYKHLYGDGDQYSTISSAGTIESLTIRAGAVREILEGKSSVCYVTKTGDRRDFLQVLTAVVEFWRNLLRSRIAEPQRNLARH